MDFITKLPKTAAGYDSIWVIVDRLTNHSTLRVWNFFFANALVTLLELEHCFHPQTDGQSERTIQTLEDMLRSCVIDFGNGWDRHLPLVEFSYNNSYHTSIKAVPFEALYSRKCRSPVCWAEWRRTTHRTLRLLSRDSEKDFKIRDRMQAARDRQKSYADKRRILEIRLCSGSLLEGYAIRTSNSCLLFHTKVPLVPHASKRVMASVACCCGCVFCMKQEVAWLGSKKEKKTVSVELIVVCSVVPPKRKGKEHVTLYIYEVEDDIKPSGYNPLCSTQNQKKKGEWVASDMSNSDELRHTDNTTLVPPRLPDTLPQVYHRRRPTLGLLILPSVSTFSPTIRRTARISVLPIEPNLAERARISAINLDDYQLDPVTPPPSPSSPFSMAA
ncbi:putative reverse transcriptase domain, ribonuclease H-like domain, aspartic peptidase domain protein [Tanacetum coccineum]|uniref:Reverse transcriptase domain, ribonuclease H-like domain, aspartic peptidase domain protein n=1 Tax=Tanacetum coccineum TaxID=301880 RepID=A0ABQ5ISR7_9ASTR